MKNIIPASGACVVLIMIVLACGGDKSKNDVSANAAKNPVATAPGSDTAEKPVTIAAKALTKEYDDNELAADGKYKGKMLAVTGKISNIAETFGKISVQLEGHNIVKTVMCSFEDSEKESVAKLKKGSQATLVGRGDGMTAGLYVGLQKCKIQ